MDVAYCTVIKRIAWEVNKISIVSLSIVLEIAKLSLVDKF